MKRRSKQNVGIWPNMRDDTLKAIAGELVRARQKHPSNGGNLSLVFVSAKSLENEIEHHRDGRTNASQVYARAAQLAAMAIRVLEEGTAGYPYAGNTKSPAFELEP